LVNSNGYQVDPAALGEIARRIRLLGKELPDAGAARAELHPAESGDPLVSDAVTGFVSGWADGRAKITENLTGCAAALDGVIATYSDVESALTRGFGGGVAQ
jgi:hypothetical protein